MRLPLEANGERRDGLPLFDQPLRAVSRPVADHNPFKAAQRLALEAFVHSMQRALRVERRCKDGEKRLSFSHSIPSLAAPGLPSRPKFGGVPRWSNRRNNSPSALPPRQERNVFECAPPRPAEAAASGRGPPERAPRRQPMVPGRPAASEARKLRPQLVPVLRQRRLLLLELPAPWLQPAPMENLPGLRVKQTGPPPRYVSARLRKRGCRS